MGLRPLRFTRITNPFAAPGDYASNRDAHGPAGHHTGIDWGKRLVPTIIEVFKRPVRSSTPGTVVISEWNSWAGHWVGVYFAKDDVLITYWHLLSRKVKVGQRVRRGQTLGRVGNSGSSTAPHLHVQANRGRTFDYHGHIAPGPWVRGRFVWKAVRRARRLRRRK